MASAFTGTFNDVEKTFTDIYTYNATTSQWSSNYYDVTNWDYFQDAIAVGDVILFGNPAIDFVRDGQIFKDIKFNVGTALVADSITLVWEYTTGTGTWATLSVTDNTNNFTTTGSNWVTFDVPGDWNYSYAHSTTNSQAGRFIRCRVAAVTNPTEGGANTTETVKCGNNAVTITAGDGDFYDLYELIAIDNSWSNNCVYVGDMFLFKNIHIFFQSGTSLTDTHKAVHFNNCHLTTYNWTLGTKDATSGKGRDGCMVIVNDDGGNGVHYAYFYSFKFYGCNIHFFRYYEQVRFVGSSAAEVLDTNFYAKSSGHKSFGLPAFGSSSGSVIKRTKAFLNYATYPWQIYKDGTYEDLFAQNLVSSSYPGFELRSEMWPSYTQTVRNLETPQAIKEYATRNGTINLVNCSFDSLTNQYAQTGTQTTWYIKYTFNLKVIDSNNSPIEGATVVAEYQDGLGEAFSQTTDANGEISEQEVIYYKLFMQQGEDDVTTYYGNPLTVTISKDGYQTKTITYTMDRKREEIEVLEPAIKMIMPMGKRIYKNLKPQDGQNKILWEEI